MSKKKKSELGLKDLAAYSNPLLWVLGIPFLLGLWIGGLLLAVFTDSFRHTRDVIEKLSAMAR